MKQIVMVALGALFLVLAFLGIFLPVLPTTPFVLLSAYFLSCNPRMLAKALKIPFFREHYENYRDRKGISRKTLVKSLVWLWLTMAVSMVVVGRWWLVALLSFIGVCVTVHLVHMSRAREQGGAASDCGNGGDGAASACGDGEDSTCGEGEPAEPEGR